MKRYLRTKDGKIIDTENISFGLDCNSVVYNEYITTVRKWKKDIKEHKANDFDTIEKLIEVGDLVRAEYDITFICDEPEHHNQLFEIDFIDEFGNLCNYENDIEIEKDKITELYTKQGRNYVLVWTKEEGVI